MEIAKVNIRDNDLFKKIKVSINRMSYVECGLCGAIRVEARELALIMDSFMKYYNDRSVDLKEYCSNILYSIIESEPLNFENYEEYGKWESSNEIRYYPFLDNAGYDSKYYGLFEEIIVFSDPACECFDKDKIVNEIVADE